MPTISCLCDDCGKSFYMKDEAFVPLSGSGFVKTKSVTNLRTWKDWIMHIQTHCEDCRITVPPSQCVADLEKLRKSL